MKYLAGNLPATGGPAPSATETHVIKIPNEDEVFWGHLKTLKATMLSDVMNSPSINPKTTENITRSL